MVPRQRLHPLVAGPLDVGIPGEMEEAMNEPICDFLLKLSGILHYFGKFEDARRLSRLSAWLRGKDVPEDI